MRIVSETWKAGIDVAVLTDIGMRRANNQDSFATLPADSAERFARRGHLFVVADGMGAHAAGELASRMAAESISQYYLKQSTLDAATALRLAVQEANADIHRRGQENPEFFNMGTTASSIAILPEGVLVAHVGDSRVYRVRDGKFEQLTFDHSLVWEMHASGQVLPNSTLSQSIPKNVITRSLGPSAEVMVDIEGPFPIKKGDRFLVCSDGLTGQVEDDEIGPLLESLTPELAARVLVDLANLRGGPDNTTLIIVHILEAPPSDSHSTRLVGLNTNPMHILMVAAPILCFVAALVLGLTRNIGPMVVAVMLGLIATAVAVFQFVRISKTTLSKAARLSKTAMGSDSLPRKTSRSAPYRCYSAKPTTELLGRLTGVLDALKKASAERKWMVDWKVVDAMLADAKIAKTNGDLKAATSFHAKAIVETMAQLRTQHRKPTENVTDRDSVLD